MSNFYEMIEGVDAKKFEENFFVYSRSLPSLQVERITGGDGYSLTVPGDRRVWHVKGDLSVDKIIYFSSSDDLGHHEYNLIIVDGVLEFSGIGAIVTSQNLAIRAKMIKANPRDNLPQGSHIISSAGIEGKSGKSFGGLKAEDGADGQNPGKVGDKGQDADAGTRRADKGEVGGKGDDGHFGVDGRFGEDGSPGGNGTDISIVTDAFDRDCWLAIATIGGPGGKGGDGEAGGNGGNGRKGGKGGKGGGASWVHTAGNGGDGGSGGRAGRGGIGGRAGVGGAGGNGGNITVRYIMPWRMPKGCEMAVGGGAVGGEGRPGSPGSSGNRGEPGEPGDGGDDSLTHGSGQPGAWGAWGQYADPTPVLAPSSQKNPGSPGAQNGGAMQQTDPPIWPYFLALSPEYWGEIV